MKVNIIAIALLLCMGMAATAQDTYTSSGRPANAKKREQKKTGFDKDKLIFGGGIVLSFGQFTNLGVSPVIGYAFNDKFSAGVGIGFQYLSIKNFFELPDPNNPNNSIYRPFRSAVYSGSIWSRYRVWNNIFVHAEAEYNKLYYRDYGYDYFNNQVLISKNNASAPAILLGAGIRQPVGERASFIFTALYDVLNGQSDYSPYGNSVFFRGGFLIGF